MDWHAKGGNKRLLSPDAPATRDAILLAIRNHREGTKAPRVRRGMPRNGFGVSIYAVLIFIDNSIETASMLMEMKHGSTQLP